MIFYSVIGRFNSKLLKGDSKYDIIMDLIDTVVNKISRTQERDTDKPLLLQSKGNILNTEWVVLLLQDIDRGDSCVS